jgi:hypothetical protein
MFNPYEIKSPTRHNTFATGAERKRQAAEYWRREMMTQEARDLEDANTAAMIKCGKWWLKNHDRIVGLLGSHEKAQADWARMSDVCFNRNTKDNYIRQWEMIEEYDLYLTSLEEAGGVVDHQMKIIQDDIDEALENGDTVRAHSLRRMFANYVQRPELYVTA